MSDVSLIDGHIDNGMTDNEIIKALENCVSDCPSCTTCPYDEGTFTPHECMSMLMNDSFNLINRQKAEIEKYRHIEQTVKDFWSELKKLSAFKNLQEPTLTELLEYIDYANTEAIKEFAERLKEHTKELKIGDNIYLQVVGIGRIDNLVKEMIGEQNE